MGIYDIYNHTILYAVYYFAYKAQAILCFVHILQLTKIISIMSAPKREGTRYYL